VGKRKERLLDTEVPGSSRHEMNEHLIAHGHWYVELRQRAKDGRMLIVEARLDLEGRRGSRLVLESTRDHAIPGARVQRELHADGLVCTIELSLLE